jgi:hypothetical protein
MPGIPLLSDFGTAPCGFSGDNTWLRVAESALRVGRRKLFLAGLMLFAACPAKIWKRIKKTQEACNMLDEQAS